MAPQIPTESESGGQPSGIMPQLPLRELGLEYVPAIPVDVGGMADCMACSRRACGDAEPLDVHGGHSMANGRQSGRR